MEALISFDKVILAIHVFAGFTSLVLFWLPIILKKGGNLHVKIGWVYVFTMLGVVITSAILSIVNIIQGGYFVSLFLGYLSLITALPLWYGITILKYKKGVPRSIYNKRRYLYAAIVIVGTINVAFAVITQFANGAILLFIFGLLGMTDIKNVMTNYDTFQAEIDPIKDHIRGLLVTGIAAYTAFFAFGGSMWLGEIFSGQMMVIPWVLPSVIGVIAIRWYTRKWSRKPVM